MTRVLLADHGCSPMPSAASECPVVQPRWRHFTVKRHEPSTATHLNCHLGLLSVPRLIGDPDDHCQDKAILFFSKWQVHSGDGWFRATVEAGTWQKMEMEQLRGQSQTPGHRDREVPAIGVTATLEIHRVGEKATT